MTRHKAQLAHITVTVDRHGSLEVHGMTHGDLDAPRIAEELGLPTYEHLGLMHTGLRSEGLSPEARAQARAAAREHGYEWTEVDRLPPVQTSGRAGDEHDHDVSTTEVLQSHMHGPSRKEKALFPFLVLAVVVLAAARASVPPARAVLAGFINPGDASYVEVDVRGWSYWSGWSAVTQGCYLRVPDLGENLEQFVTAERAAATLQFRFDLSRGEGAVYHADAIRRGGMDVGKHDLSVEVYPLAVTAEEDADPAYADGAALRYDDESSLAQLDRFRIRGFVERTAAGYRVRAPEAAVVFPAPESPGLNALLDDLAVTPAEIERASAKTPEGRIILAKRVGAFVTLENRFPWIEDGSPGRRQTEKEIGEVRLDALQVGTVRVAP